MYMMYTHDVVRKQLYLREDQDELLKQKARDLGVSEAELVRRALDRFLDLDEEDRLSAEEAVQRFLRAAEEVRKHHRYPEDWRFRREDVYREEERFGS